jgi:hypothetical protein
MNRHFLTPTLAAIGLLLTAVATRGQEKLTGIAPSKVTQCYDTLYVSTQMTSYMIFPEQISVWDLGSKSYAAKIESGNMLYVKPLSANTPLSTLLVQTKDGTLYLQYVAYRQFPRQLLWDLRSTPADTVSNSPSIVREEVGQRVPAPYAQQIDLLKKQKRGNILTRSSNRIRLRVTTMAVDSGAVYLLLEVHNRSAIPYRMQYVSFAFKEPRSKKSRRRIHPEHQEVQPLFSQAASVIRPQQQEQLAYVLPLFASTRKGYLEIVIREENGNRILKGIVPATRFAKALYLPQHSFKPTSHVPASK